MLSIRQEQYEQFAAVELAAFKVGLQEHLRDAFPLQTAMADPAALEAYVDLAIGQALEIGVDTQASVQSFADHMVLLGNEFHRNPLYASIVAPLFDDGLHGPVRRLDLVYDRAWDYLDRTRGQDGAKLIRAMARLRALAGRGGQDRDEGDADLGQTLQRIFPEKVAAHDRGVLEQFRDEALLRADADGFPQPRARAVYVCVSFLAGLGFFHDPLLRAGMGEPGKALANESDPGRRAALLEEGTMAYLDKALKILRAAPEPAGE